MPLSAFTTMNSVSPAVPHRVDSRYGSVSDIPRRPLSTVRPLSGSSVSVAAVLGKPVASFLAFDLSFQRLTTLPTLAVCVPAASEKTHAASDASRCSTRSACRPKAAETIPM